MPDSLSEFRWIGQGPYAGYPGKDRLNEFDLFHLNREDLYFQGNRRETKLALLTTATGAGVVLATTSGDIAVERSGDKTLLSQNALLSDLGNKSWLPETVVDLTKTPRIAGHRGGGRTFTALASMSRSQTEQRFLPDFLPCVTFNRRPCSIG